MFKRIIICFARRFGAPAGSYCFRRTLLPLALLLIVNVYSQSHRHWTRSFNEESSLLSGAVVGGGVGPSAIYYNPAAIADVGNSSLSFHASLFSVEFYNSKNALGDGIDLVSTQGVIQPRFISFLIQPRKNTDFSIEFAYLNNELYHLEFNKAVDMNIDILDSFPGEERYFANFSYLNKYRDDWAGMGVSWKVSPTLFLGGSMFAQVKTLDYQVGLDIEAFPRYDSIVGQQHPPSFYSANYLNEEYFHFNNYRLVWKFAMLLKKERYSFGVTIKTPSLHVFSDGKRVYRKEKRSNIVHQEPLPDYLIVDYKEKKGVVKANFKDPLSIAAGVTVALDDEDKKALYTTVEYFHGLKPYDAIEANVNPSLFSYEEFVPGIENWLTFRFGGTPVLNAAVGYRWTISDELRIMTGFRTDFSYAKRLDKEGPDIKYSKSLDLDVYHFTGGLRWRVLGQDLITGIQYSIGHSINQDQLVNLSDPVEYNEIEQQPLQGNRSTNMSLWYNSISIYFGATFNFIKKPD